MVSLRHPATRVVASSLVTQAALVISGPVAVRLLGVEGRGEVAFVFAVVLLVSQVGPWGIPQAWTYFIAQGTTDPRRLLSAYLTRYLVGAVATSALGAVGLLLVAEWSTPLTEPSLEAVLTGVGTAGIMVAVLVLACLQGALRFDALAVLQALPGLSYTAALAVLAFLDVDSIAAVLAIYFSGWIVAAAIGLFLLYRREALPTSVVVPLAALRSYGRRALISATAPINNLGIDQLAVGLLLSHHDLGVYAIALAFATGPTLVLLAITSVCTATVATLDPSAQRAYCRAWILRAAGIGALVVLAIEAFVDPVLPLAFGDDARTAIDPTRILVVAGLLLGLRRLAAGLLQGMGRPMPATYAELAGLGVMLVLMATLTGPWGVEGGCVAMLVAATVTLAADAVVIFTSRAAEASPASVEPSAPR